MLKFVVLWNIAKPQEVISPNALEILKNTAFPLTPPKKNYMPLALAKASEFFMIPTNMTKSVHKIPSC
jgi:hypothetical protein